MRFILGGMISLIGPLVAGWLIVRALWPESPRMLRFALSTVVGMGFAGTAYFAALALTDSSGSALILSELTLAAVIALFIALRSRIPKIESDSAAHTFSRERGGWVLMAAFILVVVVGFAALCFLTDYSGPGGWDAVALWNTKARFIYRSSAEPLNPIVDSASEHRDYPLLLPSSIARIWLYTDRDTRLVSLAIAVIFTIATFIVVVGGIRLISGATQAWLAGCVLAGTPFFLQHGVSQYADIVICCFITATIVLFCVYDSIQPSWRLPLLAGLMGGFAACTKNEGVLFVLIVAGSRLLLALWRKTGRKAAIELGAFGAGASIGLAALVLFKSLHSPPNPIVGNVTMQVILERMQSVYYHSTILRGFAREFHDFGAWWLYPVPLLLIHFAVSRFTGSRRRSISVWPMPAMVVMCLLVGYYAVYLFAPDPLEWHIGSSLPRLLLQIWPTALILYAVSTTPPEISTAVPPPG